MIEDENHSKRVLIVGAGIAGMQAALDIAGSGYEVVLVERLPSIGGHMHQLSATFPTLDCAQCIMTPRTVDVGRHENIRLHVYSEDEEISGEMGDFRVRIRRKPAYVDWEVCNGCGDCAQVCPVGSIANRPHERHSIDDDTCTRCNMCFEICLDGSVEVVSAEQICATSPVAVEKVD